MKSLRYLALLSTFTLMCSLCALARDKDQHSVTIPNPVHVGITHLKAGDYKVEWQGAGPSVQVMFLQDGKTVATVPAKLKSNDTRVVQDDIVVHTAQNANSLQEIDFAHSREALVFTQGGM
ncbi:MAG TPA: hypothetical protein VIW68_11370 [Candidatus Sulfotelmatobacter sp.]